MIPDLSQTICAVASPHGAGAIAVIRLGGSLSHQIIKSVFTPKKQITDPWPVNKSILGEITWDNHVIDQAMIILFCDPYSYTGDDAVEIYCHGSVFIQESIMALLIRKGARLAQPGEFTLRAFVNGKMDLLQAEAVDDLIRSRNPATHALALKQMRGNFSLKLSQLRKRLIDLTALMELEIDFSEEDVEFADRSEVMGICSEIRDECLNLAASFRSGNVLKHGIPVAIVGEPNVGKSTLLNRILNEERSIVSEIPGTTRDYVEDTKTVGSYLFRFIDTAGLRQGLDPVEAAGIHRSYVKAAEASVILLLFDASDCENDRIMSGIESLRSQIVDFDQKKIVIVVNKIDLLVTMPKHLRELLEYDVVFISAKRNENIHELIDKIAEAVRIDIDSPDVLLTNVRHYEAFIGIGDLLLQAIEHMKSGMPQDLTASFLHQALHQMGLITGEVSNEDVLSSVFGNFCIGK